MGIFDTFNVAAYTAPLPTFHIFAKAFFRSDAQDNSTVTVAGTTASTLFAIRPVIQRWTRRGRRRRHRGQWWHGLPRLAVGLTRRLAARAPDAGRR